MKESIKLILLGLGIIGYLLAYGVNYVLAMTTVYEMYEIGYFSETLYIFFNYGYPIIGVSFFIGVVLYASLNLGKKHLCSNCKVVIK